MGNGVKKTCIQDELDMLVDSDHITATGLRQDAIFFMWRLEEINESFGLKLDGFH